MHTHDKPNRRKRLAALVGAATIVLGSVAAVGIAASEAAPAGAATQSVTYSANSTRPGALPAAYGSTANSDGWALALSSDQVFNVTHHQADLEVTCHNQSNGSVCWPQDQTKVVSSPGYNYATAVGEGVYLDNTTGHLFAWAVRTNGTAAQNQAGVVCIDTSKPAAAAGSALFCGFTPLTAAGDAPILTGLFASFTAPVQIGSNWYSFNDVAGSGVAGGAGTQNTLMCFNLSTLGACSTPNLTVPLTGSVTGFFGTAPPIAASGPDVFVPVNATVASATVVEMGCFNTVTGLGCTGAWPLVSTTTPKLASIAGSPFPYLNSSGTATGICMPITGNPCFTFAGAALATPAHMAAVIGQTNTANGPAVVIGTKVFLANFNSTAVDCYNYGNSVGCANFPKKLGNLAELYTVNRDPYRGSCLWVNSDHGGAQIQNFDAVTGGACAPGPIRFRASSVVDANPTCQPTAYNSLQITNPPVSSYGSGTVQIANQQGLVQAGYPTLVINPYGVVDLSGINFATDPSPQFIINLNGLVAPPATVSLRLTWQAQYATSCISEGQTVSSVPGYWLVASDGGIFNYGDAGYYGSSGNLVLNKPIVGMAVHPTRGGYWLVASDGGIFSYGIAKFYGSTGGLTLNKPIVGMASTPSGNGYWLVASDGGIFAYGDAKFYGSTGNMTLNKPIVGMAATPDGGGYWLVASDGGIFAYGDAPFYGSTGNITLNKPIVGMAANPNGGGYWMVASDGGIFAYGSSHFFGSTGGNTVAPVVGLSPNFNGTGYWMGAANGAVYNYGASLFGGSPAGSPLNRPIVAIAA